MPTNQISKIIHHKKIIIISLCIVFLGYITFAKILPPFFKEWNKQSIRIKNKKMKIKKAKKLIKEKDSLDEKFATLTKKIQAKLPVEREESQFLTEIAKVAESNYVHIATMNPKPYQDLGAFKELSVEIEMEANLGNLVRFLHNMRESSVALVANRLKLTPKSERSALLKGQLVISTIFLKDK